MMNIVKQNAKQLAYKIVELLKVHRRSASCHHEKYQDCLKLHLSKLQDLIVKNQKVAFVLPAFPAKSPNRRKTHGFLPDLGEERALLLLNQLCQTIDAMYAPGAEIIICSDGRVFNDLIGVEDKHVDAYSEKIKDMIVANNFSHISLFALDDHYFNLSYEHMRSALVFEFGEEDALIKHKIKNCPMAHQQFNGIHRFIFEDNLFLLKSLTKNQIRKISKGVAYQVIKRSNAWSDLVERTFPNALRLSIHPQGCGSKKIGIMLMKSENIWATPWHNVVLFDGHEHILIKKKEAEHLGATPIFINKAFSHYFLENKHDKA